MSEDPEIKALRMIEEQVCSLDLETQSRIAHWLMERVRSDRWWAAETRHQTVIAEAVEPAEREVV